MSAAEFLKEELETRWGTTTTWAQHILEAMKAAGYAVVELPKDFAPFEIGPDGNVFDRDFREFYSPMEARILASRLLAAADAVEATL